MAILHTGNIARDYFLQSFENLFDVTKKTAQGIKTMTDDLKLGFNFSSKTNDDKNTDDQDNDIFDIVSSLSFDETSKTSSYERDVYISDDGGDFSFDSFADDGLLF